MMIPLQVSAYSYFAIKGVGNGSDKQKKRLDPTTNEPLFTNCTRDFIGTLDYIFYTGISLPTDFYSFFFFFFFFFLINFIQMG